jgi:phage recombination protein Bet
MITPEEERIIRTTILAKASKADADMLIAIANSRGLNPLLNQIHFASRFDRETNSQKWTAQVGIDGMRALADASGKYAGQDAAVFAERPDGTLISASVAVYRVGFDRPVVGVAYWSEYVQSTKDGRVTRFWATMPHGQLAKCAEALALRKAFPAALSGLYTPEEMAQADNVLPSISPHDDGTDAVGVADDTPAAPSVQSYAALMAQLEAMTPIVDAASTTHDILAARCKVGSASMPSPFTAAYSSAKLSGALRPDESKNLSKAWWKLSRALEKKERTITSVEDAFIDEPAMREPGED